MKILVVGVGAWGKNVARTLNDMGALGGICEVSETLRESCGYDVPIFSNFDEAIASGCGQAVAIATPAQTHAPLGISALAAGYDVFVEKPMTMGVEEAEQLCRLAEEKGRVLMVGHLLLYQPAVQAIHRAIRDGLIGDLVSIHQERLNLGRARSIENVLWSLGVHDIAVAQFLVDSVIVEASGSGKSYLSVGIEDDYYLHCAFESGVQSHLHCSWLWPTRRRQTVVIGSKAMLVYDELEQKVALHHKRIDSDLRNVDDGEELFFVGAGEPLMLEMEHFIECCRSRSKPNSDGWSALEVVRAMAQVS